jgi:hypothetical protein
MDVRKTDHDKILEEAKKRFKWATEADQRQREREREDLRFQVPEMQWDTDAQRQRIGTAVAGVPIPPRPILSIPKLDQPVQIILNQERAAHLGVNIHPLSEDADDDTAEVIQGLYRKIERDSRAGLARTWAFERAVKAGRGAYRIDTEWDEEGGNEFDQKIVIRRLLYQDAVYFDPAAQEPDYSDGEWAFVTSWVPKDRFTRLYPKSQLSQLADSDFADLVRDEPNWIKGDGDERAFLVAEYFRVEYAEETLIYRDGKVVVKEELEEGEEQADVVPEDKERIHSKRSIRWFKVTAHEVLEEAEWNGQYIPLVPVIGRELQPFDAERRWVGLIRGARDAQRLFNYAASSAVELAALEPRAPWIVAEGQIEGYEALWQQSNTRNFPVLMYKGTTIAGSPAPPPQRVQVDVGRLGPSMALLQQADEFIQASTSTFDPALGNVTDRAKSGKAIMALQSQTDAGTSHYLHNLADVSMSYEAKVILDLIPKIYDRPGRIARTLDFEDNTSEVMLNQPYVENQDTGRPQPVQIPEGVPKPPNVKHYDLARGRYGVNVTIGKSWQSRLQQGADEIGQILQAAPQLMPLIGPTYFRFRDFPGAKEIADLLKKMREKQFPGLEPGDEQQGPTPEQAQALGQENQMLKQQLQQAAQMLQQEQAKQQAMLAKAQMDNQTRLEIERIKAQTDLMLAKLDAFVKATEAAKDRAHEHGVVAHQAQQDMLADAASQMLAAKVEPLQAPLEGEEPIGSQAVSEGL